MAYSPKYVSANEVPVQIPDDYSEKEKKAALEFAESSIELDLMDGSPLPDDVQSVMVKAAIKQKATCELAKGAEHPDDTALTDLSDTGSNKADYAAQAFCDRYDELVDKIQRSGLIDSGEDGSVAPYVYSTSDPTPQNDYYDSPINEDGYE